MASSAIYTLFCVVDGESTSNAFPVEIESTKSFGSLKDAIKAKKSNYFRDVDADRLTLWKASIDPNATIIKLDKLDENRLSPLDDIVSVFPEQPAKGMIHIIVEPPSSGNATHCSMQAFQRALSPSTIVPVIDILLSPFPSSSIEKTSGGCR